MTSIGEKLRQERRRQNLDLTEVTRRTGIKANFLEAIEAEAWDRLPGTFFAKSFVRQYARALGMDASEVDAEIGRLFKVEEAASDVNPSPRRWRPHRLPLPARIGEHERGRLARLGLIVCAGLICYGAYALWQSARRAPSYPAGRAVRSSPVRTGPAATPDQERVAENGSPSYAHQRGLPPKKAQAPPGPDKLVVDLVATERTWVSVRVDGSEVFSGILTPGDRRSLEGTGTVKLHIGNAAGLQVQWNGKPVGPFGRSGEVRFVEFTREGFQIQTM